MEGALELSNILKSDRISTSELEKHLDDYRKSRAANSKKTSEKLPKANITSAFELSKIKPDFSLNYSLYSTALNYSAKARYVKNIDDVLPHIKSIIDRQA